MTSPLLDEDAIIATLDLLPANNEAEANRVATGALMLIIDAVDRKATRQQLLVAVGSALELVDALGRHQTVHRLVAHIQEAGPITAADMAGAEQSVAELVRTKGNECIKMARLLKQCPLNEDKVH